MRLGFRGPFADEHLPLQSSLAKPLVLWQVGEGMRQLESNRRKKTRTRRNFRAEGICSQWAGSISVRQLGLHLIRNWNWHAAPSVNICEEETNSKRSEVNSWQLTGSNLSSLTLMLMKCGEGTRVCGRFWAGDSIVCLAVCFYSGPSGQLGPGLQPQPAWSAGICVQHSWECKRAVQIVLLVNR